MAMFASFPTRQDSRTAGPAGLHVFSVNIRETAYRFPSGQRVILLLWPISTLVKSVTMERAWGQ